ncbi:hypothetical protein [Lacrimispora indolis]|uniref:hypothetical protein n=1 Tax=Lacrimispora indolis TaxID=69825 RepID=UPI000462A13E|nr:hypothetical protein [[Clostridium] methoxybenzovorans]
MEKRICDICKTNESSRSYKVKQSLKGHYEKTSYGGRWNSLLWTPYERIDICGECAERLLGLPFRDSDGGDGGRMMRKIVENIQKQQLEYDERKGVK